MKQIMTDTYNLAWFKLAECVSRGEKERALGVYRLLAHSLEDNALAIQLEADILLLFEDSTALEKYRLAAAMFCQEGRLLEAAAVYEHVITHQEDHSLRTVLINLYAQLTLPIKALPHGQYLVEFNCNKPDLVSALACVKQLDTIGLTDKITSWYERILTAQIKHAQLTHTDVRACIARTVRSYASIENAQQLRTFCSTVRAGLPDYAGYLDECLENVK